MEVRYVGWSINPARRLRSHTSKSTLSKEKNHRAKWVASVLRTGSKPVMEVIESGVADFAERERFWISHFRDLGCRLTNGTDGGEGMLGWRPSAEQRMAISERLKGRAGRNYFFPTPEQKEIIAKRNRERVASQETREKLSKALRLRLRKPGSAIKTGRTHRSNSASDCNSTQSKLRNMQKIGRWTLLEERLEGRINKRKCVCQCGAEAWVAEGNLMRGGSMSCGCLQREITSRVSRRHGECKKSPEYSAWRSIISRCSCPSVMPLNPKTVCKEWIDSYEAFLLDMGRRPAGKDGIVIAPGESEYRADTCRWGTRSDAVRSGGRVKMITHKGESMILSDWAVRLGVSVAALAKRFYRGWAVEQCIERPFPWPRQ